MFIIKEPQPDGIMCLCYDVRTPLHVSKTALIKLKGRKTLWGIPWIQPCRVIGSNYQAFIDLVTVTVRNYFIPLLSLKHRNIDNSNMRQSKKSCLGNELTGIDGLYFTVLCKHPHTWVYKMEITL